MKYIVFLIFTSLAISTECRMDIPYSHQFSQVGGRSVNKAERNQAKQLYKRLNDAVKKHRIKQEMRDSNEDFSDKDINGVKDLKREFLKKYSRKKMVSSLSVGSSSRSEKDFKEVFRDRVWLQKQYDALNKSIPKGDFVNMVAARPQGVVCGDPNLHDMPWGTCMFSQECEPDFRIYRGDVTCGRTELICCAIVGELYDLNMPFDLSFESSAFKQDTAEAHAKMPIEVKRERVASKRSKARQKRKNILKARIDFIMKELRSILQKAYRNSTKKKIKKTKQIKLFLLDLKKQVKRDRFAIRDIHDIEMIKVDTRLKNALAKVKDLNVQFMGHTLSDNFIVNVDGKEMMSKRSALMLQEYYPELRDYFPLFRSMDDEIGNLTYDIEFAE